jgi:hypothetical protein
MVESLVAASAAGSGCFLSSRCPCWMDSQLHVTCLTVQPRLFGPHLSCVYPSSIHFSFRLSILVGFWETSTNSSTVRGKPVPQSQCRE